MVRSIRALRPAPLVLLLAALAAGPAMGQPGTVLSNQKISDTAGNFTPVIDNLDELGGSIAHLGDLDGAGPSVAAIAIGAAFDDDGGGDRGAVYIAYLNAAGSVLSHVKISEITNLPGAPLDNLDEFGSSLAWLGDLDGAGASVGALAVGAVGDDDGGSGRGAVYILFLNASGTVLSLQKISNTQGNFTAVLDNLDEFGGALAHLGDLDGAGPSAATLAVGAIGDDDGGVDRGAVYILFLASTGNVLSFQKISNTQGNFSGVLDNLDDFGSSLAALGDLDGAGPSVIALAAGAAFDDDGGADRGAVYILFLNATGTVRSHQKLSDTQGNFTATFLDLDEFGGAVAHLGDIDGPAGGVTALAVGVGGDDDGGDGRGAVQILFLNSAGVCTGFQKISDLAGNFPVPLDNLDGFGSSLAVLGDLDGNGSSFVALAVGATGDDDGGVDRGGLYILFLDGVSVVGVPTTPGPLAGHTLGHAAPNPFRPRTTLPFRLAGDADVRIEVWDIHGRAVRGLVDARLPAGAHETVWDGRDDQGRGLSAGTYFFRMTVDGRPVGRAEKALLIR